MAHTKSQDQTAHLTLLGTGRLPAVDGGPSRAVLESFPNTFADRHYIIRMAYPEFTSLCPVTGQPDFGTIVVEYIPNALCMESKSFKLYMFAYRNHQSFMETITNTILDDVWAVLAPRWARIRGLFAPRGATHIHVFAERIHDSADVALRKAVAAWRLEARHSL